MPHLHVQLNCCWLPGTPVLPVGRNSSPARKRSSYVSFRVPFTTSKSSERICCRGAQRMSNLPVSSLHFPSSEQQSVSQLLASLRRSALTIANRLRSIELDARFVWEVAQHYNLPLIANERCGSWYIPPDAKSGSVYFKSTDGHTGQWDFNFRRLNLQLLPIARHHGGCIIVDSTRRGKREYPCATPLLICIHSDGMNGNSNAGCVVENSSNMVCRLEQGSLSVQHMVAQCEFPSRLPWSFGAVAD